MNVEAYPVMVEVRNGEVVVLVWGMRPVKPTKSWRKAVAS